MADTGDDGAVVPSGAAAGGRWTAARIAHPVADLARSAAFYRDLLGLPVRGGFTGHDGYDGVFLALPGGAELELTRGPEEPRPGTEEDLLVLYLGTAEDVRRAAAALEAAGVPGVRSANPYWQRWGRTFLDPDGYRVVLAAREPSAEDGTGTGTGSGERAGEGAGERVRVQLHTGPRERLRPSFALAEDSPSALDSHLHAGRVLVALAGEELVGHLQLVDGPQPGHAEITNMAVREDHRGRGIGARLVEAAVELAAADSASVLDVATAAADTGNLRFYQRQGFRLRSVERDAFTAATGYPPGLRIDGVELRDRVWLDRPLVPPAPDPPRGRTGAPPPGSSSG